MIDVVFPGRVGLVQRVLPSYRASFFDLLAESCLGGLSLFAGQPRPSEAIQLADGLLAARWTQARNLHLLAGPLYLCYQRGLQQWLTEWDPDVLILEANPRLLSNPLAISWMRRRGRPTIGWGLGLPRRGGRLAFLRQWTRRQVLRGLDAVIAYSTRGAAEYRSTGFPADRIFIAPNAVVAPPSQPPYRERLEGRPPRLLFVGRLQRRKRVDLLLRACGASPTPLELWIVGDGPARPELEQLAAQVFPPARFLGARHGPALQGLLEQADLLVLPGTGGLAVQQGMAHGLPVIVGEGDGTQHDLVSPENGWLIPEGDLAALQHALADALSDPSRLQRMGLASYQLVRDRYNLQAMARTFLHALHAVSVAS